jgi:hypothetical protein
MKILADTGYSTLPAFTNAMTVALICSGSFGQKATIAT